MAGASPIGTARRLLRCSDSVWLRRHLHHAGMGTAMRARDPSRSKLLDRRALLTRCISTRGGLHRQSEGFRADKNHNRAIAALPPSPQTLRFDFDRLVAPRPVTCSTSLMHNYGESVTVLMPVYNAAGYLQAAIESIRRQTYSEFEFLIVDDGSTDGSGDILQRFAGQELSNLHHPWHARRSRRSPESRARASQGEHRHLHGRR